MAIKTYNKKTKKWEPNSSMIAKNIKVLDLDNKYKSKNVEDCLSEVKDGMSKMKEDITYIYENGTIGGGSGGSGGGGAAVPVITINGDTTIIVNSDEKIDIMYTFTSPNPGSGLVTLSNGAEIKRLEIPQGLQKWTVGPFKKGKYVLTITVEDRQGFLSTPVQVTVISGALELSTAFSDAIDFSLSDDIVIPLNITTEVAEDVFLDYTFNGTKVTKPGVIGLNEWKIGHLPFMGISKASVVARNSKYTSNVLNFVLVASDSKTLQLSSKFSKTTFPINTDLLIDYRISMKGQYAFKTKYYIDNSLITSSDKTPNGVSYWNVGNNLEKGPHHFKIECESLDGISKAALEFDIEIVTSNFEPYKPITNGLIASFDASGKMNSSIDRDKWKDLSGHNVDCSLYNFNYSSNGWIDNALIFSGKSYAEIDLAPFTNGIKDGFSLELLFKTTCVGVVDAKIISCKNQLTPFQGIDIDTSNITISNSFNESIKAPIQEGTWTKATYVVDRTTKDKHTMRIYINGVLSAVSYLRPNNPNLVPYTDEFTYNGKIILGGERSIGGDIQNNAFGGIKNIRVYNKALTNEEVLHNFIADTKDEKQQMHLRKLNNLEEDSIGLPTVEFVGNIDGMDESSEANVTISYFDPRNKDKTFTRDNCKISWQGTSSLNYPVKNWTMKIMKNGMPDLDFVPVDDWQPELRWTLKANYMDSSAANNLGANKFVYNLFKSTNRTYPQEQMFEHTRANIDGFPVKLLINGEYKGIYTWNIDRYAPQNYGFVKYSKDGIPKKTPNVLSYELNANSADGAAAFLNDSWESVRSDFKCRWSHKQELSTVTTQITASDGTIVNVLADGFHQELMDLVRWVKNASPEDFHNDLQDHFSIPHLIDYYLIVYTLGMVDSLGKNLVLTSFGPNSEGALIWYPSFYDCDTMLGLDNTGHPVYGPGIDMETNDYNTSKSALWTKLVADQDYNKQIRERYAELRRTKVSTAENAPTYFSVENIMNYLGGEIMDIIGQKFYNEDAELKYLIPAAKQWLFMCSGTRREMTERWLKERFIYMDSVFEYNYSTYKAVIRANKAGDLTLRLKTYSPQKVLVSFSDSSANKKKLYVDKNEFTDFTMRVNNEVDNNIEIYGCFNLMYIDGIKNLDVASINIAQADKLIELDVSDCNKIQELALGQNTYLQRVISSDCKKLGITNNAILDLSNCYSLKKLDCSNTKIKGIRFNPKGGVLEELDCKKTDITAFSMNGQEYLKTIDLSDCPNLDSIDITNCGGLQSIKITNTKLSSIKITGCDKLENIDISYNRFLRHIDFAGCKNLKSLNLKGSGTESIKELDLRNSLNLEDLDISSTSYIQTLTFGQYTEGGTLKNYNKLKSLIASNSGLKSIRYGINEEAPEYLDLKGLTLEKLRLDSCPNIKYIKNLNYVAHDSSPSDVFIYCKNLISVEGYMKFKSSAASAFYGCDNLEHIPTIDLSETSTISTMFFASPKVNMDIVKQIMLQSNIGPKLTSAYRCFDGCTAVSGTIPENLFSQAVNVTDTNRFFCNQKISGTLPNNLLKPLTKLVDAQYMFANTNIEGRVPTDFFSANKNLQILQGTFESTNINGFDPDNIFYNNFELTNLCNTFNNCKNLQVSLTDKIFERNKNLYTTAGMFNGCSKLVSSLPQNIFNNTYSKTKGKSTLKHIDYMFNNTGLVGKIPEYKGEDNKGIFDTLVDLEDISGFFSNCSNLVGTIPEKILDNNNNIIYANNLFAGCSGLTGSIPKNLMRNKKRLLSANYLFSSCNNITGNIPIGFLDDCSELREVSGMFQYCPGLTGTIPQRISTFKKVPNKEHPDIMDTIEEVKQYGLLDNCKQLSKANSLFRGCRNLSGSIPPTLFMNATSVTDLSYIFERCYSIEGRIPKDLFKNCVALTNLESAFSLCLSLHTDDFKNEYNEDLEEIPKYFVPERLFENCFNLQNVTSMFNMYEENRPKSPLLNGIIPPKLFLTNSRLVNTNAFVLSCDQINGKIDGKMFDNCPNLENMSWMFNGTNIEELGEGLLKKNHKVTDLSHTFAGSSLKGTVPKMWGSEYKFSKLKNTINCFAGQNSVSNAQSIPTTWK